MAKAAKAVKAKPKPKAAAKAKPAARPAAKPKTMPPAKPKGLQPVPATMPPAKPKGVPPVPATMPPAKPKGVPPVPATMAPAKPKGVQPVPEGSHTVTPHLVVRGAGDAIEFYKRAFGATELYRMPGPDGQRIMHAEIKIGDSHVFLADEFPEMGGSCKSPRTLGGTSCTIHLYVPDADKTFNQAIAAGATVGMPLMNMFWGDRYGKLSDPFGVDWSIATHIEDVPPEEMGRRMAVEMAKMGQASTSP